MPPPKNLQLGRLERETGDLEERVAAAVGHWEKIERDKKKIEQEEIERGVLRGHLDELSAGPEITPFAESISRIERELARRQEDLKKLYQEEWPKERQERDSRRHEMEGLQARFREINSRLLMLKLRLAEAARQRRGEAQQDQADASQRRWNEAIIAQEMAKLEKDMSSRPATSRDVARLKDLKSDLARNQDSSQPPPIITPSAKS